MEVRIAPGEGANLGVADMGIPVVSLQRGLDRATEMGTFGKGSVTWESARRGLVLSHEDYFHCGFWPTMLPLVKLLRRLFCTAFFLPF